MAVLPRNMKHGVSVTVVAHMSLIAVIVLLNLSATNAKSTCPAVKINGPYIAQQSMRMGVLFQQISVNNDGKPVFAFNMIGGNRTYLFCYKDNKRNISYWGVGPTYKAKLFGLYQLPEPGTHCSDHPADDNRTWSIYDAKQLKFFYYSDITVTCAQVPEYGTKTCGTVKIVGANIPLQNHRMGVPYTHSRSLQYGGTIRGKPIFRSNVGDYIYPCDGLSLSEALYPRWCVSSRINNDHFGMFMGSDVKHPAEATGTWFIWVGGTFRPYPNVSVKCVDGEPKLDLTPAKAVTTPFVSYHTTYTTGTTPLAVPTTKELSQVNQPNAQNKPSSGTTLIIGVVAAVVVLVITLFVVFFIVIWKKLHKTNRGAGNLTAVYTSEAVTAGSCPEEGMPPPYSYCVNAEATHTDYRCEVFPDIEGVEASAKGADPMCEKLVL